MRVLLDTHVALWAIADDPRLPPSARVILEAESTEIFISSVVLWEISIKYALRRGRPDDMPVSAADAHDYFCQAGYGFLAMKSKHTLRVTTLPPYHTGPFDRMLVAQAMDEPMRRMTRDAALQAYSDLVDVVAA